MTTKDSLRTRIERRISRVALRGRLARWLARSRRAPVGGRVLDVQLGAMLRLDDLTGEGGVKGLTPEAARARMRRTVPIVAPRVPADVRREDLTLPGAAGPLPCALWSPAGLARPAPCVFYVHGGGWATGDLETHAPFCAGLASRARCVVLAVTYRLSPEHKFPAAVEDVDALFRSLPARAKELGIDTTRVAISGDSAGGNLCAVLARHTRREKFAPLAQFLIYPATDLTRSFASHRTYGGRYMLTKDSIDWYLAHYVRSAADERDPDASCLFADDVAGVAPAVVYTAGFDPLVDEGKAYADKLAAAAVPVRYRCFEDLIHGFNLMGGAVAAARRATEEIVDDIARELRTPGTATRTR